MKRRGKKYQVGDRFYMKRPYKVLHEDDEVVLDRVYKRGKDTIVDVRDLNNQVVRNVSVKMLRKRSRRV